MSIQPSPNSPASPTETEAEAKYLPVGNDPDFYFPVRSRRRGGLWRSIRALFLGKR